MTRALSIREPWASQILARSKRVEWRTWVPPKDLTEFLLHRCGPNGAIIALVEITGVVGGRDANAWLLGRVVPVVPEVPTAGRLGLWRPSEEVLRLVSERLK
jgi:ASCH domain